MKLIKFYDQGSSFFKVSKKICKPFFRRRDQWKPFELRDLAVISYMSSVLSKDSSLSLETPYGVPWSNIAINICRKGVPKQEWMSAINATIVGLAHADLSEVHRGFKEITIIFILYILLWNACHNSWWIISGQERWRGWALFLWHHPCLPLYRVWYVFPGGIVKVKTKT